MVMGDKNYPAEEYDFALEGKEITVLLVEDSESDAGAVLRIMSEKMPCSCRVLHAATINEAEGFLSNCSDIDVVLLDLGLPDSSGPKESFDRLAVFKDAVPIVVLTSFEDPKMAISLLGGGVQDYVYKNAIIDHPETLCHTVEFAIGRHRSLGKTRKEIEKDIRAAEDLLNYMSGSYSAG